MTLHRDLPYYDHDLPSGSFERLLRDYKFRLASEAVHQCNGNKTLAAQSLSVAVTICRDWLASNILHHEVRQPLGRASTVKQPGNVGLVKGGQDLAFLPKTIDKLLCRCGIAENLNGSAALECTIGALAEKNGAHAALANLPQW